ncbi:MAG TPA: hypothetical protein VLF18_17400 [Tahibacter sp.]|uniref:hypothetical protein n=1 Tax=Tahibacter sp. TaxID=2056211 RepID=UPI002C50A2FF|nr:hypothetical protein [Tahibacter sp.]HSX61966.1 hypothetical protein [Tahibacter sp.]
MDVCLPEELLRLSGAHDDHDTPSAADWLGAEAWIAPVAPQRKPRAPRTARQDDPTWAVV